MSVKIGNYRWRIVVLLFFATTINYIDRQVLGILAPQLSTQFGWSEADYGFIIMAFQAAYAIGLISMGTLLDKIGTRLGFIVSVTLLSVAGMFHAAFSSVAAFATARFGLGVGASANFPAAIKTVAEWFPKKERALATGVLNTGSNIGAILAPLLIPIIALKWGWQWAFISAGALGFIWLIFWMLTYKKPEENKKLSKAELDYILQDEIEPETKKLPWKSIISYKQTWGICLARFLTDPIWWFFLYWLPKFLHSNYNIDLTHIGLPLIIIYVISMGGSVFGGWMSSFLINRGNNTVAARKKTIFFMALLVVPIFLTSFSSNVWVAVTLISMATFAHQGYAANIFTIVSDIYPKNAVGTVTGLAGFAGAIGGVLFSGTVGLILQFTGSYYIVFGIASVAYLLCWLSLYLLVPNNKKIVIV
ncbi:MAG: MFS transporter [Paludibacter sp.]|nr:MFS transporter [Paludibacter sp.]